VPEISHLTNVKKSFDTMCVHLWFSTYRLYDFNRQDNQYNDRPLNIEKALDVIQYNAPLPNILPESEIIENHSNTVTKQNSLGFI
jgi:mannose-6-phosphate isomerase class I